MKTFVLAGSALGAMFAVASAAQAADLTPAGYDWTGFYLGANAGAAWNNATVSNTVTLDGTDRLREYTNKINDNQMGFTAGGLVGYNYQIDRVVMGAEADINYLGFSDSNTRKFIYDGQSSVTNSSIDGDWFGTLRLRLGYTFDNLLVYGTGGAAFGQANASGTVKVTDGDQAAVWKGSAGDTRWGWTLGGGAEYGIDNWSLGVEYLYVDLGSDSWSDTLTTTTLNGTVDYAFSTVRASVRYRFQ